MPFNRPSLSTILNRVLAGVKSRLTVDQMRRSDAEVYAREISGASHELHGHIQFVSAQVIYDTAEAEWLDRWATLWLRKPRIAALAATGNANAPGDDGSIIPAGSIYISSAGIEYSVEADATVAAGVAVVALRCMLGRIADDEGALGNLAAGEVLTLTETIPGVSGSATVDIDGITGGSNQEDDASLRSRLISRIQAPPHGGDKEDYEEWAREVPGVTRAWAYPLELGAGSVTVRFMRDNDANPIPDAGEVATVQAYMDATRPVTVKQFNVFAPIPEPLNFTISITPDSTAIRAAITAELEDLIRREAVPGGGLLRTHISEAISLAAGENDHVLSVPAGNVTTTTGKILTMGVITWL
jgi:uncharacterized phage protein gp47/JayE